MIIESGGVGVLAVATVRPDTHQAMGRQEQPIKPGDVGSIPARSRFSVVRSNGTVQPLVATLLSIPSGKLLGTGRAKGTYYDLDERRYTWAKSVVLKLPDFIRPAR